MKTTSLSSGLCRHASLALTLMVAACGNSDDGSDSDASMDGQMQDSSMNEDGNVVDSGIPNVSPGNGFAELPVDYALPEGGDQRWGFNATSVRDFSEHHRTGGEYWVTTDMTGNGFTDLVVVSNLKQVDGTQFCEDIRIEPYGHPETPEWRVHAGGPSGFASSHQSWALPEGGKQNFGFDAISGRSNGARGQTYDSGCALADGDEAWSLIDIDGDELPDLVVTGLAFDKGETGYEFRVLRSEGNAIWRVYHNNGAGFDASSEWLLPTIEGMNEQGFWYRSDLSRDEFATHGWTLQDMDGDNRRDLVIVGEVRLVGEVYRRRPFGYPSEQRWDVYLNTGQGFADTPQPWLLPSGRGNEVNGLNNLSGTASSEGSESWVLEDMTGDGRPDLVFTGRIESSSLRALGHPGSAHWDIYVNNGSGFDGVSAWDLPRGGTGIGGFHSTSGGATSVEGDELWTTSDLDGDGLPDIVVTSSMLRNGERVVPESYGLQANMPHWEVFRGTGSGFVLTKHTWLLPNFTNSQGVPFYGSRTNRLGGSSHRVGDLNADGRPDLFTYHYVTDEIEGVLVRTPAGHPDMPHWEVYLNEE